MPSYVISLSKKKEKMGSKKKRLNNNNNKKKTVNLFGPASSTRTGMHNITHFQNDVSLLEPVSVFTF